jgi:putative cyclase
MKALGFVCVAFAGLVTVGAWGQAPAARASVPSAEKDQMMKELSNWGRWGKQDELGALHLITQAKRQQAIALAKTGTVVSLMRPIVITEKSAAIKADGRPDGSPFFEARYRTFPEDSFFAGFNSDVQEFAMHGALLTHLDGLCHDSYGGQHYNGFPLQGTTDPVKGCGKLGIQALKEGIVTRGVLIDFPRLKGVASLPRGTRLRAEDVVAWEKQTGLKISSGDAIFLYTGRKPGMEETGVGYDLSIARLLKQRDVAVVSSDGANADHQLTLAALGVYLIDSTELAQAAETAARLKRWEFMLVVSPLPVPGGTGSVVNPLAMF